MLEESSDEFHDVEGHGSPAGASGFFVAEEDGVIFDLDDAPVGDGDLEDIGGKVFDAGCARSHCLAVDVPLGGPDLCRYPAEEVRCFHLIAEFGAEDPGECLHGHEEVDAGGVPFSVFAGAGASGDDVVDMGMVMELAAPGVKDAEESREIASDVLSIRGQFLDGLRGGGEQGGIGSPLIAADEASEVFRDGEGDHEVVSGQLSLDLSFEPLVGLVMLAVGAVAVAAGAVDAVGRAAFLALVDRRACGWGAAVHDGVDHFAVYFRHGAGVLFQVFDGVGPEDVIYGCHGRTPS